MASDRVLHCVAQLRRQGKETISRAIERLHDALRREKTLEEELRARLLEQLEFVAEQLLLPEKRRRPGVVRAVLTALSAGLESRTALAALWRETSPAMLRELADGSGGA